MAGGGGGASLLERHLDNGFGRRSHDSAQCQHWFSAPHLANTLLQHLSPRHIPKISSKKKEMSTKHPLRNARDEPSNLDLQGVVISLSVPAAACCYYAA